MQKLRIMQCKKQAHNQDFAKRGGEHALQVKNPLGDFRDFLEKIAILTPLGSHFARF